MPRVGVPKDVAAIRAAVATALNAICQNGKKVGDAKFGAYAFYDFDGEPIYVGQTAEKLRVRIGRHLTNQRTDAVAMNVLDPFEVYEVEVWPLWDLQGVTKSDPVTKKKNAEWDPAIKRLNAAEYSVFQKLLEASTFGAVLNEKDVAKCESITLPKSMRACIIPDNLREARKHPDIRIARRASTIANLARVISERDVSSGLRRTLRTQAKRLERLASTRFEDFATEPIEIETEE